MTQTANDIYLNIRKTLKENDIFSPDLEAKELTSFAYKIPRDNIASWAYIYSSDSSIKLAYELMERRLAGEPLAYIIGEWDFHGLTFKVTPDVLIPRSDTETLVSYALSIASEIYEPKILDLCCGSGCIGIAILKNAYDAKVIAIDISSKALMVARENARIHDISNRYITVNSNVMLGSDKKLGKFNIICANPPYIPKNDILTLDTSVRDWEPLIALDGGDDGLDFYKSIISNWYDALESGGYMIFECGIYQAGIIAQMMDEAGYTAIKVISDLSGVQRVISGRTK